MDDFKKFIWIINCHYFPLYVIFCVALHSGAPVLGFSSSFIFYYYYFVCFLLLLSLPVVTLSHHARSTGCEIYMWEICHRYELLWDACVCTLYATCICRKRAIYGFYQQTNVIWIEQHWYAHRYFGISIIFDCVPFCRGLAGISAANRGRCADTSSNFVRERRKTY